MQTDFQVRNEVSDCTLCPLSETRKGIAVPALPGDDFVPGGIALMLDIPVAAADHSSGEPLAGARAEVRMLGGILERAGLGREELLLLYRVRCAPQRGHILDYPEAMFNCDVHTGSELRAYDPAVVLVAGTVLAAEAIQDAKARITNVHSKPRHTGERFKWGARCWLPTFHPYAAIRNPALQKTMVHDFELARAICADRIF